MTVRGSCSCYGHADSCKPFREQDKDVKGMVHGLCECQHNTKGNNCELCKDLFNDLPWKPATGRNKNECKGINNMFTNLWILICIYLLILLRI